MPSELRDSLRYCKFGAESSGLCDGTSGELLSGYTGWEAEIVFDFRTRTRLSSRGMPINQKYVQALGCSIDASGKTCWSGTHDNQIVD